MSVSPSPGERPVPAPPAGEEVHLPGPSALPPVTAVAITLIVVGTTITWFISIAGGIILLICLQRWIRDTRRDVSALPDEHH